MTTPQRYFCFLFFMVTILVPSTSGWCFPTFSCSYPNCGYMLNSLTFINSQIVLLTTNTSNSVSLYAEYEPVDTGLGVNRIRSLPSPCGTHHNLTLFRMLENTTYNYYVYTVSSLIPFTPVLLSSGNFTTGFFPANVTALNLTVISGTATSPILAVYPNPAPSTYTPPVTRDAFAFAYDTKGRIVWWINMHHPLYYFDGFGFDKDGTTIQFPGPLTSNLDWFAYTFYVEFTSLNLVSMGSDRIQEWYPNGTLFRTYMAIPDCQYVHHEASLDGNLIWSLGYYSFPATGYSYNQLVDTAVIAKRTPLSSNNYTASELFEIKPLIHLDDRTANSNGTAIYWAGCPATNDYLNHTEDWTHGNSINRAQDFSGLIISLRHLDAVLAVKGVDETGQVQTGGVTLAWQLGGKYSSFSFPDPSDIFYLQHDAQLLSTGNVLLFDNGNTRPNGTYSRALELQLNWTSMTAHKVWEGKYTLPNGAYCFSYCCGRVQRLSNGNTHVQFPNCVNASPDYAYAVEFDPSGNVLASYRTNLYDFTALYRSMRYGSTIGGEIDISPFIT